jgi:sigma-B regulation protein RsbU (phosphoserine phosphatase)
MGRRRSGIHYWPSLLSYRIRPRRLVRHQLPESSVVVPDELQRRAAEIEEDLQLARDIQQGLLLEAAPRLPGWEITAVSLPARVLGGDLYDFLPLSDSRQGLMIGDVSGKGLAAALRMAVARTVFRHAARLGESPAATLSAVNRGVLSEIPQGMVTMLYAWLDTNNGELFVANAGHNYPLLVNGSISEIELSGVPLGVDADIEYHETHVTLAPGESVVLYTDGMIEAENAHGAIYSFERLQALIRQHADARPRALVALMLHEMRAWSVDGRQSDDVTIVVLRRRLEQIDAELRTVVVDVLGAEPAGQFWLELERQFVDAAARMNSEAWLACLSDIRSLAQQHFGRGPARELYQQLRLTLEDYRLA